MLAVSSLAGQGAFGKEAYKFVDFLVEAGQSLWQTLPLGPVGESLSPYQSRSAFAGNPDFIDRNALRLDPGRYAAKGARYNRFIKENDYWLFDYSLFEAVRESQGCIPLYDWPDEIRNPSSKTLLLLREKFKEEIEAW